jgi:hypothetical protein
MINCIPILRWYWVLSIDLDTSAVYVSYLLMYSVDVVEVYKWIVLVLSISSDFWLRWLMHEA